MIQSRFSGGIVDYEESRLCSGGDGGVGGGGGEGGFVGSGEHGDTPGSVDASAPSVGSGEHGDTPGPVGYGNSFNSTSRGQADSDAVNAYGGFFGGVNQASAVMDGREPSLDDFASDFVGNDNPHGFFGSPAGRAVGMGISMANPIAGIGYGLLTGNLGRDATAVGNFVSNTFAPSDPVQAALADQDTSGARVGPDADTASILNANQPTSISAGTHNPSVSSGLLNSGPTPTPGTQGGASGGIDGSILLTPPTNVLSNKPRPKPTEAFPINQSGGQWLFDPMQGRIVFTPG